MSTGGKGVQNALEGTWSEVYARLGSVAWGPLCQRGHTFAPSTGVRVLQPPVTCDAAARGPDRHDWPGTMLFVGHTRGPGNTSSFITYDWPTCCWPIVSRYVRVNHTIAGKRVSVVCKTHLSARLVHAHLSEVSACRCDSCHWRYGAESASHRTVTVSKSPPLGPVRGTHSVQDSHRTQDLCCSWCNRSSTVPGFGASPACKTPLRLGLTCTGATGGGIDLHWRHRWRQCKSIPAGVVWRPLATRAAEPPRRTPRGGGVQSNDSEVVLCT